MQKIIEMLKLKWKNIIFLGVMTLIALVLRYKLFPFQSDDYNIFLKNWFDTIKSNGGFAAVGMKIGDYMPPYFYILAFLTYLPFSSLTSIKIVSCLADLVLAFFVMRVISQRYPNRSYGTMAYALVLLLPSVFLNSAGWGQCDAIFTGALIASLYYLLVDKPNRAMIAFGISFVFKLQAIFFIPFLLVMLIKRKIKLRNLIFIPAIYFISILPAWIMGRSFWDLITVYFSQSQQYPKISMNIPNLYVFFNGITNDLVGKAGVFLAGGAVLMLLYVLYRKKFVMTQEIMVSTALLFAILVPFTLPHMHERYYYLADILSILYAFYFTKKYYTAVIMCIISGCVVSSVLFGMYTYPAEFFTLAILINMILIFKHLIELINQNPIQDVKQVINEPLKL